MFQQFLLRHNLAVLVSFAAKPGRRAALVLVPKIQFLPYHSAPVLTVIIKTLSRLEGRPSPSITCRFRKPSKYIFKLKLLFFPHFTISNFCIVTTQLWATHVRGPMIHEFCLRQKKHESTSQRVSNVGCSEARALSHIYRCSHSWPPTSRISNSLLITTW